MHTGSQQQDTIGNDALSGGSHLRRLLVILVGWLPEAPHGNVSHDMRDVNVVADATAFRCL